MKESWECVTTGIVKKSFHACGISVSVDGSEDYEIHYLKDGSVAADAHPAISETTSQLASENDSSSDTEADPLHWRMKMKVNLRRTRSFLRIIVDFM